MSADFDAAVAAMLGDVHSTFGRAATYTPPAGSPVPCVIVVDRADEQSQLGQTSFVGSRRLVQVRKAEVAAPAKGGVFAIGAEGFRIVEKPRVEDPDALVWTCLCDPD